MKRVFVDPRLLELTNDKEIIYYNDGSFRSQATWDFLHTLYVNLFFLKKEEVRLHSNILKHKYGTYYARMLQFLIDNKFIIKTKNHLAGSRARGWSLFNPVDPVIVNISDELILSKRGMGIQMGDKLPDVYEWLVSNFEKCVLDVDDIELNKYHFSVAWLANSIKNREWFYSIDSNGRLHSPFTTIKKELREKIKIDNEEICSNDIINSQPLFLKIFMKSLNIINDTFSEDVNSGIIYEKIANTAECSRKQAKEILFKSLFGRNTGKTLSDKIFKNTYPEVFEFMKNFKIKSGHHSILANKLQHMEADWLFNIVIPQIRELNIPIFTVHDSIYYPISKKNEIEKIWNTEINKLK